MNIDDLSTSEKIKVMMARKNVTSAQLGRRLKISSQAFNYHLRTGNWKMKKLEIIARHLKVTVTELL